MIGKTISHYRIVEKLGEGGMGVVYVAEDTILGRRVAIKTLTSARGPVNQHFRMRFLREAQAISKLSHPHIANIHEYGETEDGEPYIVMELVEGQTLADLIKSKTLTIPRTLEIIKQVAEALDEAHRRGTVHRDIKPSNIAINERGKVKVLDFGLAKHIAPANSVTVSPEVQASLKTQTREGMILGTPMYLSPEQALGIEVDARSDLFSLASVLYECIAGRPPFSGKSDIEICAKVIRDDPTPPSEFNASVPTDLDRLTLKALAKKPEERCQSAHHLIIDLQSVERSIQASGVQSRTNASMTPPPLVDSVLHAPRTRGISSITSSLIGFRVPFVHMVLALSLVSLVAFALWYGLRLKPFKPSPDAQRYYELATSYMREGAYYKAIKPLQYAISSDTQFLLARARLAEAWTELDYSDKAKDELLHIDDQAIVRSNLSSLDAIRLQAVRNTIKRDFAKAVENYQSLVGAVASQDVADREKAHAYLDLGRAYVRNQERDKAIQSYQAAVELDSHYAAAFLQLGMTYGRSQKYVEAYSAFEQAYKLFDITSDHDGIVEVMLQRGVLLAQQGKVTQAREQLTQALQRASVLEHKDKQIKALLNLSYICVLAGDSNEARQYSSQALELAKANSLENLTTGSLIDIGNTYFANGSYSEADNYFNEGLKWAELYKGERNGARALLSLASLRSQQDNPDAALSFVSRALPFYERGGFATEILQAYSIRGRALNQTGQYDAARHTFELQLQSAQRVNDPLQMAAAHEGLGLVFTDLQKFPEALAHFDEQQRIGQSLANNLSLGYAAMNRGNALWQMGRYDEARAVLDKALKIGSDSKEPNKDLLAWANLFSAQMALSQRKLDEAIASSREALGLAGSELKPVAVRANYTLGLAYALSGRAKLGYTYSKRAVDLARNMRDPRPLANALLALAETALDAGEVQTAITTAAEARRTFATAGQRESEWRALVIEARSAQRIGDRLSALRLASQAASTLENCKVGWGVEFYNQYKDRPDVADSLRHLALLEDQS